MESIPIKKEKDTYLGLFRTVQIMCGSWYVQVHNFFPYMRAAASVYVFLGK